jgi:hypothetical protein
MHQVKINCVYCPPPLQKHPFGDGKRDWAMHPSWTAGVDALNTYSDWVSAVVLPIAFQWIEEHKAEVYATVPDELRDDVGVVIAAAFKLIQELPAYKNGLEKRADYEAAAANAPEGTAKINPVWAGIAKKIRSGTEEAFEEQSSVLGEPSE